MLKNKYLNTAKGNVFVKANRIPLGINTYKGNNPKKDFIVSIPYKSNGSIVIIATSGWGKSVLLKRVIDYVLGLFSNKKAGLIIDTQGVDHRLLNKPTDNPYLFIKYGEMPIGIENIKTFCPVFASKKAYAEDIVHGISLNDLDPYDLRSSNLGDSSVIEFFKIKQMSAHNREVMNNPKKFYREVLKIKATKSSSEVTDLDYDGLMHYSIKESILRTFSWWDGYNPEAGEKPKWMTKAQWELRKRPSYFISDTDKKYKPTFWNEYKNNIVVIENLMDAKEEREGMSIYGGYYLRDAYDYCSHNKSINKNFEGMFVCVEEANLFLDADDKYLKKGSNYYLTEILCRGFKFEMFVVVSFQSIQQSNYAIKEYLTSGSNPVIIGNLTPSDRDYLSGVFPSVKRIKLRDRNEIPKYKWGACEWLVYYNDRIYDTFVPYPSLSMYYKRGK